MMFYGQNNAHYSDDKKLIQFMTSTTANTIVGKLEYAPLSKSIHTAINTALGGTSPCLNP